jgi:hypothetical protein
MTIPLEDRAGYITAADPDWLDTLNASGFDRLVYYKNPYNAPKLPIGSWFLCYRRGQHPSRLHLAGIVAAVDELSLDEVWSRYGLLLGVGRTAQSHPQWISVARSVLRDHVMSVCCIELQHPRWYQPPILLSTMGIAVSGGTGQMGQALSHEQIDRCEDLLLSAPPLLPGEADATDAPPRRTESTVVRVVRSSAVIEFVKSLYDFKCQVCSKVIVTPRGLYAEGAHIQPLGSPHNGRDDPSNVLCLCPEHHVMLDYGAFSVAEDYSLLGIRGRLVVNPRHPISRKRLRYHREHVYVQHADKVGAAEPGA